MISDKSSLVFSGVIFIGLPPVLGSFNAPETIRSISGLSIPRPESFLGIFNDWLRSSTKEQNPSNPPFMDK